MADDDGDDLVPTEIFLYVNPRNSIRGYHFYIPFTDGSQKFRHKNDSYKVTVKHFLFSIGTCHEVE